MEKAISHACGGILKNTKTKAELAMYIQRLEGRALMNIGLTYGAVTALIGRAAFDENYIEITMVEVSQEKRGKGEFKNFVDNMMQICKSNNKGLIVGAVTSERLYEICKKQGWKRFPEDPTSYVITAYRQSRKLLSLFH